MTKWWGARRVSPDAPHHTCQPACKPGSVGRTACAVRVTAIPLGRRLPGTSSNLPGRQDPDRSRDCSRAVPIRSCSRWGLPCRRRCRQRGALLPHLFTLAATIRYVPRRFVLCGTFPEASPREGIGPAGRYPAPLIRGARTFLPGDLSVPAGAAVRPTDALAMGIWRAPVKCRVYQIIQLINGRCFAHYRVDAWTRSFTSTAGRAAVS